MDFYLSRNASDPEWVARAALFHGHLGPWLIAGAMIGRDAVRRLDTPGHWKIDVVCWMPPDKQRTPFSCVLDGLQAASGATLGKQNIRFAFSEQILSRNWPVVHVKRMEDQHRPAEGLVYEATQEFHLFLKTVTPDRLEEDSRRLAAEEVERLFVIRAMRPEELAPAECGRAQSRT